MLPKWTVLNIGSFTRNKFWGERDDKAYRNKIFCTSTLIQTDTEIIVADPSMDGDGMAYLLDSRCGLSPRDVTAVFVTHAHGDHFVGLDSFPHARWFMARGEIEKLGQDQKERAKRFLPAEGEIFPGVRVTPLPGHTHTLAGLAFDSYEGKVTVAGDAVMTRDFFRHRTGYHNSENFEEASRTIDWLARTADVVVPGHDNYFYVDAAEAMPLREVVYTK